MQRKSPRAVFVGDDEIDYEGGEIAREAWDQAPSDWVDTGLLDAHGKPIYRPRSTVKFGFTL